MNVRTCLTWMERQETTQANICVSGSQSCPNNMALQKVNIVISDNLYFTYITPLTHSKDP